VLHRLRFLLALLALLLVVGAGAADAVAQPAGMPSYDLPTRPRGPVLDQAELLSPAERNRLSQKLATYTDTTSTAIVVVTVPSLNGAPIADYTVALGRAWGVGQEGSDNGAVVLVSSGDRKVFIATGYGLEGAIPDALANRIVDRILTPALREGRFYAGLDQATTVMMNLAAGEFSPSERLQNDGGSFAVDPALLFIGLIFLYFIIQSFVSGGGRGGRRGYGGPIVIWGGGSPGSGSPGGGFGRGGDFGGFGGGSFGGGGAGGDW
jgi:uncharacterized protein